MRLGVSNSGHPSAPDIRHSSERWITGRAGRSCGSRRRSRSGHARCRYPSIPCHSNRPGKRAVSGVRGAPERHPNISRRSWRHAGSVERSGPANVWRASCSVRCLLRRCFFRHWPAVRDDVADLDLDVSCARVVSLLGIGTTYAATAAPRHWWAIVPSRGTVTSFMLMRLAIHVDEARSKSGADVQTHDPPLNGAGHTAKRSKDLNGRAPQLGDKNCEDYFRR